MDSADTSMGFTDLTTAVLRELRGEGRGAQAGPDSADHFVAADGGSAFTDQLRRLQETSRSTAGIVGRTFEAPSREAGTNTEPARGLQEESNSR